MDKHSVKHSGGMDGTHIFSYADRSNLVDLAAGFAEYMKQAYPQVKQVKNVTADHVQAFMSAKCDSASQATLDQYASRFGKLERLVNDTYKSCNVDFHSIAVPLSSKNGGGKVRCQMLATSDYSTLLNSTTNTNLRNALTLSYCCGLRAAECSKLRSTDYNATDNTISIIDSKGKRSRTVKVPQQHISAVRAVMTSTEGRICSCQTESLQKAMRRQLASCGLAKQYPNGAMHLCRKAFATNMYQELRNNGVGVQGSLSAVSKALGHGANRNELMKQYICCPIQ